MFKKQVFGQALCFLAEHYKTIVGIFNIRICFICFGGKIIHFRIRIFCIEIVDIVIVKNIEIMPIIKPASL